MYFIDLFSGIGGFRSALEREGHECLAFAEIDKHARQSYKAVYNTENEEEWHDVTAITNEQFNLYRGVCDIIVGGFPCQAFSVAGKRKGFEDTRGTLFFEVARAIKEIQPRYALLENVKGLFSHDKGRTFGTIIQALDELGYIVEWGLFNSKYWGVPQNRERVYILATRKDVWHEPKIFDLLKQQTEVSAKLMDVLEDEVEEKYYLHSEKAQQLLKTMVEEQGVNSRVVVDASIKDPKVKTVMNALTARYDAGVQNQKSIGGAVIEPMIADYRYDEGLRIRKDNISPCLRAKNQSMGSEKNTDLSTSVLAIEEPRIAIREATRQGYALAKAGDSVNYTYPESKTRRGRVGDQIANTLQAGEVNQGVVLNNMRIRKLTPLECWRLQGFKDEQFYAARDAGVSNSQLYKQAGNSVTVDVVHAIIRTLEEE